MLGDMFIIISQVWPVHYSTSYNIVQFSKSTYQSIYQAPLTIIMFELLSFCHNDVVSTVTLYTALIETGLVLSASTLIWRESSQQNTRLWPNVVPMLAKRRRRWTNIINKECISCVCWESGSGWYITEICLFISGRQETLDNECAKWSLAFRAASFVFSSWKLFDSEDSTLDVSITKSPITLGTETRVCWRTGMCWQMLAHVGTCLHSKAWHYSRSAGPEISRITHHIFTHLKLCLATAIHNFKWVKIYWQNLIICSVRANLPDHL